MTDPYATENIPAGDLYADVPLYGRYKAKHGDSLFKDLSPEQLYGLCTPDNEMIPGFQEGRRIYAIGGVIIKGRHLRSGICVSHEFGDSNEVASIKLVKEHFPWIPVPTIYFQGKLNGDDVLIQSRIEGVALAVAWPYLSVAEKTSFKEQARHIATALSTIQRPPQYVFPDPKPVMNKQIQQDEADLLFSGGDLPLGFAHNDLQPSNIIVKDSRIVGIVDWEMSGFFGDRAIAVHRQIRCPGKSAYKHASLSEEKLNDLTFWHDLFDK